MLEKADLENSNPRIWFGRSGLSIGNSDLLVSLQGLILLPILDRSLGTDGYGIWSVILVTISLAGLIAVMGLGSSMIRHLSVEKEKERFQTQWS